MGHLTSMGKLLFSSPSHSFSLSLQGNHHRFEFHLYLDASQFLTYMWPAKVLWKTDIFTLKVVPGRSVLSTLRWALSTTTRATWLFHPPPPFPEQCRRAKIEFSNKKKKKSYFLRPCNFTPAVAPFLSVLVFSFLFPPRERGKRALLGLALCVLFSWPL